MRPPDRLGIALHMSLPSRAPVQHLFDGAPLTMKDFSSRLEDSIPEDASQAARTMAKILRRIARTVEERADIAFNLRWEGKRAREEGRMKEWEMYVVAADMVEEGWKTTSDGRSGA